MTYGAGETVSWTGSGTFALDVSVFADGTYDETGFAYLASSGGNRLVVAAESADVPLPPALSVLALGLGALVTVRLRRR